ncbi:MAG: 7-cyano-7-deazaguanine synthase [Acidobacteriota bacterium]
MQASAVLLSGGLDSGVLAAAEIDAGRDVWPIHMRAGLAWEDAEFAAITALLAAPPFADRVHPLVSLSIDMRDVYPSSHWAVEGRAPHYDEPDETVYLEGRNITLIAKAAVLCARLGVSRLVLGPLAGNPFPDATPEFFATMARAMSLGLAHSLAIDTPFRALHKADVVRLGARLNLPFELTLSCMQPIGGGHCGKCNKCRERQEAFAEAGVRDPTTYLTTR